MDYLIDDTYLKKQILLAIQEEKQRRIEKKQEKVYPKFFSSKRIENKRKRDKNKRLGILGKKSKRRAIQQEKLSYFMGDFYQEKKVGDNWYVKFWSGMCWSVAIYTEESFRRYKNYNKKYVKPMSVSYPLKEETVDLNKPTSLSDYQKYQNKMRLEKDNKTF
jgi:hypothetical protein